jgi:hypothetical protein
MAEWFKAIVLKTVVFNRYRGFESHFVLPFLKLQLTECNKILIRLNNIIGNVRDCKSLNTGSSPVLAFL